MFGFNLYPIVLWLVGILLSVAVLYWSRHAIGNAALWPSRVWGSFKAKRASAPAEAAPGSPPPEVEEDPGFYYFLIFCGLAFVGLIALWSVLDWNGTLLQLGPVRFNAGPEILLVAIVYFVASLRQVGAKETAGAYCYGRGLRRLDPRLRFLPRGLIQIEAHPRGVQEVQFPHNDPEMVFHGDDKEELPKEPKGMVRPIRIMTGGPEAKAATLKDEADLLEHRMALDVSFVGQWRITDTLSFIANYGSEAEVEKQMRDVGETTLAEEFAKRTPATIIKDLGDINVEVTENIHDRFPHAGLEIVSFRLLSPNLGHNVSSALAAIPEARAKAAKTVIDAEAEKIKRAREGEGEGAADKARFTERGKGLKAMKEDLGVDGNAILAAETSRDIAKSLPKDGTFVLGAGAGIGDIVGAAKVVQEALKK